MLSLPSPSVAGRYDNIIVFINFKGRSRHDVKNFTSSQRHVKMTSG